MWDYIVERAKLNADYIVENSATVRQTAKNFGISKSTVHKDVAERLKAIDYKLYLKVKKVLDKNLRERHIRGGNATKQKYKLKKMRKNGQKK